MNVRRRHINAYIKEVMGEVFTAKDFRTWAGTLICASELARRASPSVASQTHRKKMLSTAVKATAGRLGNTAAVCRSAFISPAVIQGFSRGQVIDRWLDDFSELGRRAVLHGSEKALLAFLASSS